MAKIKFLNISVDNLTMQEAVERVEQLIVQDGSSYVVTPNLDHIVILEDDQEFAEVYSNADLVLADGKPLIWISKLLKNPIKEKISGSDFFPYMCEMCAKRGFSIFILGAADGVAEKELESDYCRNCVRSSDQCSLCSCTVSGVQFGTRHVCYIAA